jgi:hypothetical protein
MRKRRAHELYELNKAAVNQAKRSMKVAVAMVAMAAAEKKYRIIEEIE